MHAVHLFGLGGISSGLILLLYPHLFTIILGIIGSYIMLQTQKDEAFQKKNYQIQNDLELERLKLIQRQQSSSEEVLKQMEIATLKERNRISHALHDQLGHTLSASIMQLEALQIITTEPVVEEKLEHLSSILQQEMDNIRLTIHQMYDDSFSLSQRMDTLLQPLKEKAQLNFTNTTSDSIPINVKYDILTICKELTTNFMKHSNGTQIQLFLLEQKTTYTIDYRDNGDRPTNTPSGMGLTMMKELVEKHNGMIKTILIDDDFLVLQALETILSAQSHIEVVGMGSNGAEAIQLYEQHQPDLVLMDIRMEPTSGIDAASHILQDYPEAKILFLTTFQDDEYITKALAIGCKGYLLKQHIKGIIPAIEAVMNHQIVYDSTIDMPVKKLVQRKTSKLLNERENELLYLIAEGYNNKEIAEKMYLSEGTIRNYLSLLLEKLNLRDRTQLAIYYYKDLVE